jgi:hypothetical protein
VERRVDRRDWWERGILFLIAAVAIAQLVPTSADPDLWGHVRFGLDFLESGSLDEYDPYAFTSVQEWINHEWMSEVAFAAAYRLAGSFGLVLLKLGIGLLIAGALYLRLRKSGLDVLALGILLLPIVLLLTPGLVTVRPHLFTYFFLVLLLLVLEWAETSRPRVIFLAPVILAVWINFHGGVLAGLGVLGIWTIGRWIELMRVRSSGSPPSVEARVALEASVALLLGFVSLLANPYGWQLPAFLVRTATIPRPDISEWAPTSILSLPGLLYLALLLAGLLGLHWTRARKRAPGILSWAALAILPLSAVRHLQLFAIGTGILLAPHFASAAERIPRGSRAQGSSRSPIRTPVIIGCFAVGVLMLVRAAPRIQCAEIDADRGILFPVRAVAWLAESEVEGNLATYFDWGEYALWHLYPEMRVSMDGRRETIYPDSIYEEYLRFQNGIGEWDDHIDRHGADLVLFSRLWPAYNLMQLKPGWELLYEDSLAGVFAPSTSARAAQLRATPLPDIPVHGVGLCAP